GPRTPQSWRARRPKPPWRSRHRRPRPSRWPPGRAGWRCSCRSGPQRPSARRTAPARPCPWCGPARPPSRPAPSSRRPWPCGSPEDRRAASSSCSFPGFHLGMRRFTAGRSAVVTTVGYPASVPRDALRSPFHGTRRICAGIEPVAPECVSPPLASGAQIGPGVSPGWPSVGLALSHDSASVERDRPSPNVLVSGADQAHSAVQMLRVHRLDRLDRGRGIRRDSHQRKLVDLGLGELQSATLQRLIAKRAEANRHAPDQLGLHRLPSHVHQVLQRPRLIDLRQGRPERDPRLRGLSKSRNAHRLVVLMLPKQRDLLRELRPKRVHDVTDTIRLGSGRNARDGALLHVNRLDFEHRIGAVGLHLLPLKSTASLAASSAPPAACSPSRQPLPVPPCRRFGRSPSICPASDFLPGPSQPPRSRRTCPEPGANRGEPCQPATGTPATPAPGSCP